MCQEDSRGSLVSSNEGEETETAAEGEGDEDSVTRCICDFEHDDGYMICCDKCCVWQHVDCMGIDRSNIPEEYLCEQCQPRRVDRTRARNLQLRKQTHADSSSSEDDAARLSIASRRLGAANRKRPAKKDPKKVVKRQRRDSAAVAAREQRVSERRANRKKELGSLAGGVTTVKQESKRIAARRKSKGKPEALDEDTQDCWTQSSVQLRQWIDSYEEAVTNHYSPELRARIGSIKVNGVHSDFKVSGHTIPKCRTSLLENGVKVLISSAPLNPNQPIVEIRGKYMLATQQSLQLSRRNPPPYLFFYQLPKEGTEVCVDARTYGNDARFIRRSCRPNAEVRHCIEKGTLHLYLVALVSVERHAEITLRHEDSSQRCNCPPAPTTASQQSPPLKKEPPPPVRKEPPVASPHKETPTPTPRKEVPVVSPKKDVPAASTPRKEVSAPSPKKDQQQQQATTPVPVTPVQQRNGFTTETERDRRRRGRRTTSSEEGEPSPPPQTVTPPAPSARKVPKSPVKNTPSVQTDDSNDGQQEDKEAADKRKMTREERKMEAIMKAFERLEKAEQRKQEMSARQANRKDSGDGPRPEGEDTQELPEIPIRRKGRRTRGRSMSGASAQQMSTDEGSPLGPIQSPQHLTAPVHSPASPPLPPSAGLSSEKLSNCNSLGFKFPKTKKVLMNEWLNKAPEPPTNIAVKAEPSDEVIACGMRSGCAGAAVKKRWLRQAISEECDLPLVGPLSIGGNLATGTGSSPNSRAGSPPCSDYVTPLKKRRLARESLSSEQSFTPPTTPASDKEEARSPEEEESRQEEEGSPQSERQQQQEGPSPPALSMAARCVEEAVLVLSAEVDLMEKIIVENMVGIERKMEINVVTKDIEDKKEEVPVECEQKFALKREPKIEEDAQPAVSTKTEEDKAEPAKLDLIPAVVSLKAEIIPEPNPEEPVVCKTKAEMKLDPKLESAALLIAAKPKCEPNPAVQMPSMSENSASEVVDSKASPQPLPPSPPPSIQLTPESTPAAIKRKLSISEYRQRKQRAEGERSAEGSEESTPGSVEEEPQRPLSALSPGDSTDPAESAAFSRWSSEPTLVERQRENLTERLKREFGLFLEEQDPHRTLVNKHSAITSCDLAPPEPLDPPPPPPDDPLDIPLPPLPPEEEASLDKNTVSVGPQRAGGATCSLLGSVKSSLLNKNHPPPPPLPPPLPLDRKKSSMSSVPSLYGVSHPSS